MDVFPRVFLLVFCQLAAGGLFCLSIAPFHEIARGYYKSSAFVYVLIGALALAGRLTLWWSAPAVSGWTLLEITLWGLFVAFAGLYLASLWGEQMIVRARLFSAAWMSGFAALIIMSEGYRQAPLLSFETLLFPASFVLSALLLGTAASGMLLGHWYLIDRDLSLRPLVLTASLYTRLLIVQAVLFFVVVALLSVLGAAPSRAAVAELLASHSTLLTARVAVCPFGAGVLAWMIRKTLDVPQTMAATGLFYIAVLAVIVGEFLGRFLLFRSGLPL